MKGWGECTGLVITRHCERPLGAKQSLRKNAELVFWSLPNRLNAGAENFNIVQIAIEKMKQQDYYLLTYLSPDMHVMHVVFWSRLPYGSRIIVQGSLA
jgi:hypothetical protein